MASQWWSWLLTVVGVTGLLLAGSSRKAGWAVGFSAQGLWLAYAVATHQWGFIVSAVAYGSVYARNWLRWRKDEKATANLMSEAIDRLYERAPIIDPGAFTRTNASSSPLTRKQIEEIRDRYR